MLLEIMRALALVLLVGDIALGAKPTEIKVSLDKAVASSTDNIYYGQSEIVVMTIEFPAGTTTAYGMPVVLPGLNNPYGQLSGRHLSLTVWHLNITQVMLTRDVKIELLPSTTETVFALGELINHTVGADLTSVGNSEWFSAVTRTAGPEYTNPELGVYYDTRAAFDLGDVVNGGSVNTLVASTITIFYEIVYVSKGSYTVDQEYWVSCGMAYNADAHIWISQFSYILKELDTTFTATNDFSLSSLTSLEDGGILGMADLTMKIAKGRSLVKVEALVLNETHDVAPVKIEVISAARSYDYFLRPSKFQAAGYESCSVRDSKQQSLQLDLGYIVNKDSQKASPNTDDYTIVVRISWLVTNASVVGNVYSLAVGVDLDADEISVATFDVTVISRSSAAGVGSHVTSADSNVVPKGGVALATVSLATPVTTFNTYVMKLSTSLKGGSESKLSILSYTYVSRGDNILCDPEDTVQLLKFKTDGANPAVTNEANITFTLLNTGLMTGNEFVLRVAVMGMVDAVKDTIYELNVELDGVNQIVEFTIGDLATYDESVPYVFTTEVPNGTRLSSGSMFDVDMHVTTTRDTLPGPMTIELPIPDATPYIRFVEASTLTKGSNVPCPPSGNLEAALSSWNSTENDNARAMVSIQLVCNFEAINATVEDLWTIRFKLALIDHADIMSGGAEVDIQFGVGANFSGNQIFVGGETVTFIPPDNLTEVKFVTGVTVTDMPPDPPLWPGDYQLQWSTDMNTFYSHQLEWNPYTSLTQSEFTLKKPLLTRYTRLSTPSESGSPTLNYTVSSTNISGLVEFVGDTSAVANLVPKLMFALDGDIGTCMNLPVKNDTTIPPFLITQFSTKVLNENGIVDSTDLATAFKVRIVGEGISCNATSGPQRTMVWHPTEAMTGSFHGKFAKCANVNDTANFDGTKQMCEYDCACADTVTCGHIILAMIHDETFPSGTYNLCDINLTTA